MIGKEILNYRIESLIGKGGMGTVYLASNLHINQRVAIKALNKNLVDNSSVQERFRQEASNLLTLDHNNIVKFLNFVENEDGLFIIMEYVDGITLEDFITQKEGLLVEKRAYAIFDQILTAMAYAHKRKIVHRDIKPANIILTSDNEGNFIVKILDFGIAKIVSKSDENEKKWIVGTPSYMSPEQVQGDELDERSDIYSLGVLLHQMLTGRAPYDATTLSELGIKNKVVNESLPRMKEFYPYVSDKAQKIVNKATQKEKGERFQSCNEFRKAWKNAIQPDSVSPLIKYGVAAIVVLLLGIGTWIWDYNRTKIYYYKDYVEQWGVPVGIYELSTSEFHHREKTYRFEYKKYKLQHLALVNSKGNIVEDGESERFDRPINADFIYQDKDIAYVLYKDRNGKVIFKKRYAKKDNKINMYVFEYNDQNSTEKRLPKDLSGYVRLEDEYAERGQISRFALEFDNNGFVSSLHYWNRDGQSSSDKEHIYGKRYERDKKGRTITEYNLAHNDSVTATSWGLGIKKFQYDDDDNLEEIVYLSPDGSPAYDVKDGIAIYTMEYDEYGNTTFAWHKSPDGNLMLPKKFQRAGIQYKYNDEGQVIESYILGIDKKPMYSSVEGMIGAKHEYDGNGYENKTIYIDEKGKATISNEGITYVYSKNDARGNALELSYFDIDNKAVEIKNGYSKIICEYDSLGNQTACFYYNTKNSLCVSTDGIAGFRVKYNDKNKVIEFTNYGINNKPCENNDGIVTTKYDYDSRGNQIKEMYYTADGKSLKLSNESIAGTKWEYDDNGNETRESWFDTKGNATVGTLGYAGRANKYNDMGYLTETQNLDINNQLVFVQSDGYAIKRYNHDNRGNLTEEDAYNANGKLIGNIVRHKYDNHDNQIETAYFDQNNNPTLGSDGYFKVVSTYDNRNQKIEIRYYDATNRLFAPKSDNYAILRNKYDNKGNCTEVGFFNSLDKPVAKKDGYAFHKSEYDAMGRIIRQTYYDENGVPTKPSVMVPERLVKYDKWGNMIYLASADGHGHLIDDSQLGYAIERGIFDIRGNVLEESYYNKNDNPIVSKEDNAHKITYTYNSQSRVTEIRCYDIDGLRKDNYAIIKYKYNAKGQLLELAYFNYVGKPVDVFQSVAYKLVYTYDSEGNSQYIKYYKANGELLPVMAKYNKATGNWDIVPSGTVATSNAHSSSGDNWRGYWLQCAQSCPFAYAEEIECLSITLSSNTVTLTMFYTEISKYSVSNSELQEMHNHMLNLAKQQFTKSKMPSNATIIIVGIDKAKRDLFMVSY